MKVFYICTLLSLYLGVSNSQGNDHKIVGGYIVTSRSQFAYQVSLRQEDSHFCGAVLLDEWHVLTAAHCLATGTPVSKLSVVLGGLNLRDGNTIKIKIDKITYHPKYSTYTIENDIGILRLKEKVKLSSNIKPIGIWNNNTAPSSATTCVVSGWGSIRHNGPISQVLMAANLNPVDQRSCNISYGGNIKSGMICAAAKGKDACQGDSGGPLVCNDKLVGIVSFGIGCANASYPGVYTYVKNYTSWIDANDARDVSTSALLLIIAMIVMITNFISK